MNIANLGAVERIARVLVAEALSGNGHGDRESAAADVDETWRDYRDIAVAILKTLREPDAAMAAAGDVRSWNAMIHAALGDAADGTGQAYRPIGPGVETLA